MKTIALLAPTSHTSARCSAATRGADVTDEGKPSAVAAYAITHSQHNATLGSSVGVFVLRHQRQRRLEKNEEVEQHRPVLDIIEIELDAFLDFLFAVDFAAPAVDLRPAGNARLDAVTREIAVHRFVEQPSLQFALHGVRPMTDQREVAFEHDVEELRQFVEAGLADKTSDAGNAAVVLGHDLCGERIGLIVVQRAKLEDVDALVVEAESLLAEQHRTGTVEFYGERDQCHERRGEQQNEGADDVVEQPLHHQVPVGDRRLENIEGWDLAEIGIGAGTEAQLVGVGGKPDVYRQHPQFFQHLENPRLRRNRQREQHQVDAGAAGKFDDIVDLAEFCAARAGFQRAIVVAVIEYAEDVDIRIVLGLERFDQFFAVLVRADHDGAAVEPALTCPAAHHRTQEQPSGNQRGQTDTEKCRQPESRYLAAEFCEERCADKQQEHEGPGRDHPRHLPELAAKHLYFVDIGGLEADHRGRGHAENGRHVFPVEAGERRDISKIECDADEAEQDKIGDANGARDYDRRIRPAHFLVGDGKRRLRQPPAPFDRRAIGRGGHHGRCRGL